MRKYKYFIFVNLFGASNVYYKFLSWNLDFTLKVLGLLQKITLNEAKFR